MPAPFPRGIRVSASSLGHGSALGALYSAAWRKHPEHSHAELWSAGDEKRPHRVTVDWDDPVAVRAIRVRFGHVPPAIAAFARRGDELRALETGPSRLEMEIAVGGDPIDGISLEQPAGTMRLACLAVVAETAPEMEVSLVRGETVERPAMPLACDGDPFTYLDASDADALEIALPSPRSVGVVTLDLVGDADALADFWPSLARRDPWTATVSIEVPPATTDRVRIALPTPPSILGITSIRVEPPRPIEPVPPRPRIALPAHRRAASLGVPGTEPRVGVAPDATFQIRPGDAAPHAGSHAQCLHVSLGLDAAARAMRVDAPILDLGGATALVDPESGALEVDMPGSPRVETATFDWLWRLPVALREEERDRVCRWRWPSGALALEVAPLADGRSLVRAPLSPTAELPPHVAGSAQRLVRTTQGALAGLVDFAIPDPAWDRIVRALLTQAALFVKSDGRIPYALWPSVYDEDIYGLEEDWLFHALACFGCTGVALRALRASYLGAAHLSKHHYLRDLRNGLTPWQTERILRLAGERFDALAVEERGRLRECATWLRENRAKTAGATGATDAHGIRTFPGLLPPFRFGGDLDFPTQSLYTDAASAKGLESLARLVGGEEGARLAAEATEYRAAILAAFDAVRVGDFQPLHTGGGDPGSYYQLMAAGILDPLDFFADDDPRADRIDSFLERSGRLFEGLPRFDEWGAAGHGIDAHYAVGYLLRALRMGRRDVFWTGLSALATHAMDPEVFTFREVDRIDRVPPRRWQDAHWPGRRLGQTEPCVGGVGVTLLCVRSAIVQEVGASLRFFGGVPASWWRAGELRLVDAPTLHGRVSVRAILQADPIQVDLDSPAPIEIVPPDPSAPIVRLPPGRHRIALRVVES